MKTLDKSSLRIVFFGTPGFGIPSLNKILSEGYNLVACISQPDKKSGRGHKIKMTPVKEWAKGHGIPCYQPAKISSDEGVSLLNSLNPDLCITAAYGQILSDNVLSVPVFGIYNIHASLLPEYRGSAPINWAIIKGEKESGVTIMKTVRRLDAGDIILQKRTMIGSDETAGELYTRLSILGAEALSDALGLLVSDSIKPVKQDESSSSYFPMFAREFGKIDFNTTCSDIYNFYRGTFPYPGCYFFYKGVKIKVVELSFDRCSHNYNPGMIVKANHKDGIIISCCDGLISIDKIKYPGKGVTDSCSFTLGHELETNYYLE